MSFKVSVPGSGHEFSIENDEKVLDAALRQGVGLPYGCRNGACGKCAGDLLAGEIEYDKELRSLAKDAEKQGKALFCQALAKSDLSIAVREISAASDIEPRIMPCRVESKQLLSHDVMQIMLKLPEHERLQFLAGQYLEFILKDGKRRAFSIANAPHDDNLIELQIRHVPDGHFGDYVFEGMKPKTMLRIEAPLGSYYLREDSGRPIILMGGGTGFAPLNGMLKHAFQIGLQQPIHLFCGVRAKRDLYMDDIASRWAEQYQNFQYTPVLSQPAAEDGWTGKTGYVHAAVVADYPELSGYDVYMSGPPPMIKAGMELFYARGLPQSQIYSDSFEYSDDALLAMGITKPGS